MLSIILKVDGFLFLMIGVVVFIIPSPQPGLTKKVNEEDLLPFSQTRRLLASMFIASALLLLAIGFSSVEVGLLQKVGVVRILSFLLVIGININQFQSKRWKAAPLMALISIFSLLIGAYGIGIFNA